MPGNQNVSVWTVSDRKKLYDDLDSYFSVCFQWLTFSGLVLQRASGRKRQVREQFGVQWSLVSIGMSCLSWQSRRKVTVLQLTLTDTRTQTHTHTLQSDTVVQPWISVLSRNWAQAERETCLVPVSSPKTYLKYESSSPHIFWEQVLLNHFIKEH